MARMSKGVRVPADPSKRRVEWHLEAWRRRGVLTGSPKAPSRRHPWSCLNRELAREDCA